FRCAYCLRPPRLTLFPYTTLFRSTGGVYKARERIHRIMADIRLLAIPASRSRVADSDPNCDRFYRFAPAHAVAARCTGHCSTCRSEEHTSELQSRENLVCRLLLEK